MSWSNQAIQAAPLPNLWSPSHITLPPGVTELPVTPTASPSVHLRADGIFAGYGVLTLHWWGDAAGTENLGSDSWHVNTATNVTLFAPSQAPFFQVSFDVTSAASFTGNLYAAGTFISVPHIVYPLTGADLAIFADTVPASPGKNSYPIPWIRNGLASFSAIPNDTAGKLHYELSKFDEAGNFIAFLYDFGTPTAPMNELVALTDDEIVTLTVINNDTAAHSFSAALVPSG